MFWVKLICPAGVSSSCAMVVMRTGAFIVFCPSEESLQTSIHSSTYTFFQGLAGWHPIYVQSALCDTFPFPWGYQVLVWHHCHHVLASSQTRQSKPLLFFPRGGAFSMVKTIACCPCHVLRVTSTLAVGNVAKIARRCRLGLSRCCATRPGFL